MPVAALKLMDAEEFLEWSQDQEERYELVDGRPVLMAGAKQKHDQIVVNLLVALGTKLRGGPCRPSTADIAARMTRGNVRRPDVTIDCGRPDPESASSTEPTVFFEVLSRSTRSVDMVRKAHEYRQLPSLRAFVLIEPDQVRVQAWTRDVDGDWGEPEELESLTDVLRLPVGAALSLAEVYEGVEGVEEFDKSVS